MDNGLRVELPEPSCIATPGEAVSTRVVVYNTSRIVDDYRLTVSGIDPSWVEAPSQTARLFPEGVLPVLVTFAPPRAVTAPAGDYPFTVTVFSTDNPGLTAAVNGTLTIDPFVEFGLQLDGPRQQSGEVEGRFAFKLTNSGNADITVALDATEATGQLDLVFLDQPVLVPVGAGRVAALIARPTPASLDQAAIYQIEVGATIAETSPPQHVAQDLRRKTTLVTFQTVPVTADPPMLSPQSVELSGEQTEAELVLRNRSATPRTMALSGSDKANALAFAFVGGVQTTVPPQDEVRVPVLITCRDRTKLAAPPAPTVFTITATPIEPSGEPQSVAGEVTQPELADIRLQLDPELASSTAAVQVRLSIGNASPRPATFAITATSGDPALTVTPAFDRIEVGANDRVVVPVDLVPNPAVSSTTGQPRSYSIDVAPVDAPAHAKRVGGRHVFVPMAEQRGRGVRWRLLLPLTALLLALGICGVAYTGLFNDDNEGGETPTTIGSGAEAASLVSPTAAGMGSDGDPGGDGNVGAGDDGGGSGDAGNGDDGDDGSGGAVTPEPNNPGDGGGGMNSGATWVVACDEVNIRSQPKSGEPNVFATLGVGTEVKSRGDVQTDDVSGVVYQQVFLIDSGQDGWIIKDCLEVGGFNFGGDEAAPGAGQQEAVDEARPNLAITDVSFYRPSPGDDFCKIEISVRNDGPDEARGISVSAYIQEDVPPGPLRHPYGTWDLVGPTALASGEVRIYYNDTTLLVGQGLPIIYSVEVSVNGDVVASIPLTDGTGQEKFCVER